MNAGSYKNMNFRQTFKDFVASDQAFSFYILLYSIYILLKELHLIGKGYLVISAEDDDFQIHLCRPPNSCFKNN